MATSKLKYCFYYDKIPSTFYIHENDQGSVIKKSEKKPVVCFEKNKNDWINREKLSMFEKHYSYDYRT